MDKTLQSCIITLIEDDVINYKLISTLSEIGIDASCYASCSAEVVRYLMRIDDVNTDDWYEKYYDLIKKGKQIDISSDRKYANSVAVEIYKQLVNS